MHREDNSRFLLFIEPKKEQFQSIPAYSKYVAVLEDALAKAKKGISNYSNPGEPERFSEGAAYRGVHYTPCGQTSDNVDYLLENGMITNSLAAYYLLHYPTAIPASDLQKLEQLYNFYQK